MKWYSSEKSKSVKLYYVNCIASNLIEYIFEFCTWNKNYLLELINLSIYFPYHLFESQR